MPPLTLDESELAGLLEVGRANGLDALGIAAASTLDRARAALFERRQRGLHADMAFTYRNPERSTEPSAAVAGARSIIVGARRYLCDEPERPIAPSARIARYAWIDHYAPLRAGLWAMAHELRRSGWKAVAFADDNSIVDREVAWRAGIGWFGKNANLLLPQRGQLVRVGLRDHGRAVAGGTGASGRRMRDVPSLHRCVPHERDHRTGCDRRQPLPRLAPAEARGVPTRAPGGTRGSPVRLRRLPGGVPAERSLRCVPRQSSARSPRRG